MAKAKLNPVIMELHGKLGDLAFRRTRNGGTSLIRKADMSKVQWSPAQAAHRHRFREAVAYAKQLLADPQARAVYEELAAKQGKRAFEVAVSEYFQKQKE
jgi:hypothetical protein